jgi:hypothetical protein
VGWGPDMRRIPEKNGVSDSSDPLSLPSHERLPTLELFLPRITDTLELFLARTTKVCLVLSGASRPRWKKAGKTIRLPPPERSEGTIACG